MKLLEKSISCAVTLVIEFIIAAIISPIGYILALLLDLLGIRILFAGPIAVFLTLLLGWAILYGLGR